MSEKRIQFKRGTAADVANQNPLLADGEPLWVDGKLYVGDGVTLLSGLTPVNEVSAELADIIEAVKIANTAGNGAGLHNSIYRGKYLGDAVPDEHWAAIKAGTFEGLWIGDYWTINGVDWIIADFDYFFGKGDNGKQCADHHILMVPRTLLYLARMNATKTTDGGYAGSEMYKTNLANAKTTVNAAFGAGHILTVRRVFVNAVTSGVPNGFAWFDSTVDLMSEAMVYGCRWIGANTDSGTTRSIYSVDWRQISLFRLSPERAKVVGPDGSMKHAWLCDVTEATTFAVIQGTGMAAKGDPTNNTTCGVWPCFCIYGGA